MRLHSRRPTLGLRGKATAPTRHISLKGARAAAPGATLPHVAGVSSPHHPIQLFSTSQDGPEAPLGIARPETAPAISSPSPAPGLALPPAAILQPTPPPSRLGLLASECLQQRTPKGSNSRAWGLPPLREPTGNFLLPESTSPARLGDDAAILSPVPGLCGRRQRVREFQPPVAPPTHRRIAQPARPASPGTPDPPDHP